MSRRRKVTPKAAERRPDRQAWKTGGFQPVWLAAVTALLVAAPLVPSESTVELGTGVVAYLAWSLLLWAWFLTRLVAPQPAIRWGAVSVAVALFLAWQVVSGLAMAGEGQPRAVVNSVWQAVTFAIVFFLVRQVFRRPEDCRALVSVMVGLAVGLSVYGYYQYVYEMPQTRQEYESDPEAALLAAGIIAPEGSPQRELFESRLYSLEPTATFALANSFAGFVVPWAVLAVAVSYSAWRSSRLGRADVLGVVLAIVVVGGCALLTRSLTAWLATCFGLFLLALFNGFALSSWSAVFGWRLDRRVAAVAVMLVLTSVAIAAYAGVLDWVTISSAQKSLLYRIEYWRATMELIRDYAWLGCGPGNFQQFYPAYKLPAASETIADPHNFMFEIWATAGTPALLAFFAVLACAVWQICSPVAAKSEPVEVSTNSSVGAVYVGAAGGLLIAFPMGAVAGFVPNLVPLLGGAIVATVLMASWRGWVRDGELAPGILVCGLAALLTNLLAAGGIGYYGVAASFWTLLALALNLAAGYRWRLRRGATLAIVAASSALVVLLYLSAYRPVLVAREKLASGGLLAQQGRTRETEAAWLAAASADPLSPRPWENLAKLRLARWLASGGPADDSFAAAAQEMLVRDRRSFTAQQRTGNWYLAAFRSLGNRVYLEQAIEYYRRTVEFYPNYNRGHAQLAWALYLSGNAAEAGRAADRALRLDAVNPHSEQKLKRMKLYDPQPAPEGGGPRSADRDAEQWMLRLRNMAGKL